MKKKHPCAHVLNNNMLTDNINMRIITYVKYLKQVEFGKNEKVPKWRPNNASHGWVYFSSLVELPTAMIWNYNNYKSVAVADKNVGINKLKGEIL